MTGFMQRVGGGDRSVQDINPSRQQRGPSINATGDSSRLTRKYSHHRHLSNTASDLSHDSGTASLSRKPSQHRSVDEEAIVRRKASFRQQHPQDAAILTRKLSNHHAHTNNNNNNNNNNNSSSNNNVTSSTSSDKSKLTRHMSFRNDRKSSELEKEDRRRRRNRESARRARDRERSERMLMERAYETNEERIKQLEGIVDELSSELRRHNTISTTRPSQPRSTQNRSGTGGTGAQFDHSDERPSWFGAAF